MVWVSVVTSGDPAKHTCRIFFQLPHFEAACIFLGQAEEAYAEDGLFEREYAWVAIREIIPLISVRGLN